MSEATLVLNNVHVAYGHKHNFHHVLNGFSMQVAAGELACLLGASGCGKTTALRAIAGFEHLTQGTIHVGGRCVAGPDVHLPPEQRNVGMVFQDYALFPHLTAAQNIAFGLRKQPKDLQQSRVRAMLELVDLASWRSATRMRCPADNSSESRSHGHWPRSLPCCCSMSRYPASTPTAANAWGRKCVTSYAMPDKPRFSSHTVNRKPS